MRATIKITDTNVTKLVRKMIVLIDTREKENSHIISYLEKHKIKYKYKAMECFDYSCELEKDEELGLPFDISLINRIGIERKGSGKSGLSELAGNFTTSRNAFEEKWQKAKYNTESLYLVVENGSWEDIKNGNYRSNFASNSFCNSLISWRHKYGFQIDFVKTENTAEHIVRLLADKLKKVLQE